MLSRRTFLGYAGAGSVMALVGCGGGEGDASVAATSGGRDASPDFNADLDIELRAVVDAVPLLPGATTGVMRYVPRLIAGDPSRLATLPDTYLGPIITARTGENVRVRLVNDLAEETIVHWHGLRVPEDADGHPRLAIAPGETYVYEFTVIDPAGTYWFHPHTHGRTGYQAYFGLAGLFIIRNDAEERLHLPGGAYDLPLVIQDRSFTSDNALSYTTGGRMGGGMAGFFGDRIMVNGAVDATLSLETSCYRLRLLNGSNARVYKLALSDGSPLTVIGSDGGVTPAPVSVEYVTLAPGERVELFADFSGKSMGETIRLVSLAYDRAPFVGNMGGMMTTPDIPVGSEFTVATFTFDRSASTPLASLPATLLPLAGNDVAEAVATRSYSLFMAHGSWTLNGRTFVMEEVADDERVRLGDVEVWEYVNRSAQIMAHPMHVHGVRFQVVSREHDGTLATAYATVAGGFVDSGWKDTVLVMPGERVRLLMKFDSHTGLFLNHCHNLEHHDGGMMRNFRIE